jgi:putative FmdB family regulatory protein
MPLYEYRCADCAQTFEALVQPGESAECPACASQRLERLLSVPAAPRVNGAPPLPTACRTDLPPCGPGCCRIQ